MNGYLSGKAGLVAAGVVVVLVKGLGAAAEILAFGFFAVGGGEEGVIFKIYF